MRAASPCSRVVVFHWAGRTAEPPSVTPGSSGTSYKRRLVGMQDTVGGVWGRSRGGRGSGSSRGGTPASLAPRC